MTKDEALTLALEVLEDWDSPLALPAIIAIKEALAQPDYRAVKTYHEGKRVYVSQPAQEPVGSLNITSYKGLSNYAFDYVGELPDGTYAVYTAPPQRPWGKPWVSLTDEERNDIYNQCQGVKVGSAISLTEAKLKEKNT